MSGPPRQEHGDVMLRQAEHYAVIPAGAPWDQASGLKKNKRVITKLQLSCLLRTARASFNANDVHMHEMI